MKRLGWILGIALVMGAMYVISGCDDDTNNVSPANISQEDVNFYATLLTMSDLEEVDETTNAEDLKTTGLLDACFSINVEQNQSGLFWPRIWTLNYASDGCVDPRGNVRKGSIHVEMSNYWKLDSALRTVQYLNYYYNENKFEGTLSILNTGINEEGQYTFRRKFENGLLSRGDTAEMTWNCDKEVVMTSGYDSWILADDAYDVTGGSNGLNFDGNQFMMQITNKLHYRTGCFFPVSGTIEIETDGQSTVSIDYGNGECDNIATVTQDGISTDIELY
jgi:hypothetical protein